MKRINKSSINNSAKVLSRAFFLDPLFQYFFPDEGTRKKLAFYTFRFILSHACNKGFVFGTSSALEGVAIWLPSGQLNRNIIDQLRFGAIKMFLKQGKGIIQRQIAATDYMKSLHTKLLSDPHLYLSTIGIDSEHRGKGFASQLLRPMLEKADAEHINCYLDTHNESNISLYQQFGFQIAHESVIPDSVVRHWAMIRDNK